MRAKDHQPLPHPSMARPKKHFDATCPCGKYVWGAGPILARRILVLERALSALVVALDGAFISTWQSTSDWDKELETARALLRELGEQT